MKLRVHAPRKSLITFFAPFCRSDLFQKNTLEFLLLLDNCKRRTQWKFPLFVGASSLEPTDIGIVITPGINHASMTKTKRKQCLASFISLRNLRFLFFTTIFQHIYFEHVMSFLIQEKSSNRNMSWISTTWSS